MPERFIVNVALLVLPSPGHCLGMAVWCATRDVIVPRALSLWAESRPG